MAKPILVLSFFLCAWLLGASALAAPDAKGLLAARAGFATQAAPSSYKADGPAGAAKAPFEIVHYRSPAGSLVAYLSRDPGDGKKRPAVLWAHGGFGGIGAGTIEQVAPLVEAGLVVMCPAWRGESDNKGRYEMFYGEVDDALAALDHLAKVPYVDSSRIYVAGHSTGGTIALLVAESTDRARAVFSLGGAPDIERLVAGGGYPDATPPFPAERAREAELRSPLRFVAEIRKPTFYFEGSRGSAYVPEAEKMAGIARERGVPFSATAIAGGTHFTIVPPLLALIARKISADDPSISAAEAQAAFSATRPISSMKHAPTSFTMELRTGGYGVCQVVPEDADGAEACDNFDPKAVRERTRAAGLPIVAMALVEFDGWSGSVLLSTQPGSFDFADVGGREKFVKGMRQGVGKGELHGDAPGTDYTPVQIDGRQAIKTTIALPVDANGGRVSTIMYAIPSDGTTMGVQFIAPTNHIAELARFAEASIATVHLERPRASNTEADAAYRVGYAAGRLVMTLLLIAGLVVGIGIIVRRTDKPKRR